MAIGVQRRRVYTQDEVEDIVRASERRLSRAGRGETGHSGRRHVLITNVQLEARGQAFYEDGRTDIPIACAFVSNAQAFGAVTEVLNSQQGQDALRDLDDNGITGTRVRVEATVQPIGCRYSSGMGIVRVAMVTQTLVLIERIEQIEYHGIHIHTAFPLLAFRRGRPAWLDHRNVWH